MKKMTIMCMAALLLMAVSCKKEKANEEYTGEGFRATTESHTGDGNSKTHLEDLSVKWDNDDAILVASSTCTTPITFSTSNPQNEGYDLFTTAETLPGNFYTPDYMAYYPAAKFSGNQLTLPATQTYAENTFANGANPMAAISTNTDLPFKNLCGILKLQLFGECTVKSICVTSRKSGEQLWGTGVVTFSGADATLGTLTGGDGSITLDCGAGVDLNYFESTATNFLFVIPAGALSEGFTVTVTDTNDKTWSKTTTANNMITKSKIKAMPAQLVTQAPADFTDFGTHVGGDGPDGTSELLHWAKCNLGATNSWDKGAYYMWGYTIPNYVKYWGATGYTFGIDSHGDIYLHRYCVDHSHWRYQEDVSFEGTDDDNLDGLTKLINEEDAAYVATAGENRMPTYDEMHEFYSIGYFEWTEDYNGTGIGGSIIWRPKREDDMGRKVTVHDSYYSFDDPHIFVPKSGRFSDSDNPVGTQSRPDYALFWTKSLFCEGSEGYANSTAAAFSEAVGVHGTTGGSGRAMGLPVRPVLPESNLFAR